MDTTSTLTRWIRLVLAAAMAAAVGLAISPSATTAVVLEDFPDGPDVPTGFEMDGNKGTDGVDEAGTGESFDWDDILAGTVGPYSYSTTDVNGTNQFQSLGIVASSFNTDTSPAQCSSTANDDGYGQGAKIDDNPWNVISTNTGKKADACSGATALEIIRVIEPDGTDQIHYILYTYWTRSEDSTGDMTVYQVFNGTNPDPLYRCDDILFEFDYNPSSGVGTIITLEWSGPCTGSGMWVPSSTQAVAKAQTGQNVDPVDVGTPGANEDTFGESAIDLTASGIVGVDSCDVFTTEGYITRTGNDQNGSTVDNFAFTDPIVVDPCNTVDIGKTANVTNTTATFQYLLSQADNGTVHSGSLSATGGGVDIGASTQNIQSNIAVGETHEWTGVIAESDYELLEAPTPDGWALVDIRCTWYDPFTDTTHTNEVVTDKDDNIIQTFAVPPPLVDNGVTTSCVIDNETSAVQVVKAGAGDPAAAFDFTITDPAGGGTPVGLQVGGVDSPLSLGDTSDAFTYTPGTSVTITESLPASSPAWSLDSISCEDDQQVPIPTNVTSDSVSFETDGGTTITCTFTNEQQAQVIVAKTGSGSYTGPFTFVPSWGNAFPLDFGESLGSGDIAPGDYDVTEALTIANLTADPDFVGNAACVTTTPGSNTSSSDVTVGDDISVDLTLGAGDIVTCTFTNDQLGRIVVEKSTIDGDDTFAFTGVVTGSITTSGGVGQSTLSADVVPADGPYAVAETPTPGYTLTSATCGDDMFPDAIDVPAGEIVTCTFVNTRNSADFTLEKVWVDAIAGDTVTLAADGSDTNAEQIAGVTAIAPAGNSDTMRVYSGEIVDFSETFGPGVAANYITQLKCVEADGTVLIMNSGQLSGQLTIADEPSDITCTFTNTRRTSSLVLQKEWVNGRDGDTSMLTAGTATATSTSEGVAGPTTDTTNQATLATVFVGDTIDLSEVLSVPANYDVELACDGGDLTYTPGATSGSVEVLAADEGNVITCTFTNERKSALVLLTKSWADSPVNGDTVGLSITGGLVGTSPGENSNDPDDTNDSGVTLLSFVGDTLTLAETFDVGDALNYDTTLDCTSTGTPSLTYTDGDLSGSLEVTAADENTQIFCTFENTRKRTDLTLAKTWVNPFGGDTATLTIEDAADAVLDSDTAVAPAATGDSPETADTVVYAGDTVTVSEAFGSNTGTYDITDLTCSGGSLTDVAPGEGDLLVTPASTDADITCTFTNTRTQAQLTLEKVWVDAIAGDTVTLTADDTGSTPGSISTPAPAPAGASESMLVLSGDTVNLSEAFTTGLAANYETSLVCNAGTDELLSTTGQLTGQLAIAANPSDITCTFTNTRKSTTLELRKAWEDAAAGDAYDLSIDGINDDGPITASAAGGTGAGSAFATATVFAGETVRLTETEGVGNTGTYDITDLSCGVGNMSWAPGAGTGTVALAAADVTTDPIVCTFTNVRRSADLTVIKVWDDPVGDGAVQITATGSDPDVGNTIDAASLASGPAFSETIEVFSGETVPVGETFTAGGAENYSAELSCTDGTTGTTAGVVTVGADPVDVTCTFTNTRLRADLTLLKSWVGPVAGDTTELSISSNGVVIDQINTADASDGGGTGSATATVYAGTTVTLSETIDPSGTNVALYDATAFSCSAGTANPAWVDGDTSLVIDVAAADVAGDITCTVENTARRGDILIIKAIDGVSATFDFLGDWMDPQEFQLTPPDNSTDQQLFEDVLVPKDGSLYNVSEVDPGPGFGTLVSCADGDGSLTDSGPSAPAPGLAGTIGLDNDETVTCTFNNTQNGIVTIIKSAVPQLVQDFEFTGDFGPFTLDDDGVGDNFIVFDNVVPGEYSVTETAVPGWDLTALTCSDANSTGDVPSATATINVEAAEALTCTFTNTAQLGDVSVTKTVTGVDAALAWSFDFTIAPFEGTVAPSATQTASGTGNTTSAPVTWTGLVPGVTYTITETVPAGWTQGAIECTVTHADDSTDDLTLAEFTIEPGDSISCDFANAADPGEVSVTKTVTGVDAALAWSFDFTIAPFEGTVAPSATQTASGTGNTTSAPVTWTGLVPGVTYTITETVPAGWTQGAIECTVTPAEPGTAPVVTTDGTFEVTPGATVDCDFANAAVPATVEVTKTVAGGLLVAWAFDFTISPVPDGETSPKEASGVGDSTGSVSWSNLVPGSTYTVAEVIPNDGFENGALTCSGVTDLDQADESVTFVAPLGSGGVDISCDITNTAVHDITSNKVVDGAPVRDPATAVWTVGYLLTVSNAADAGDGVYDVFDEFDFGAGVTIVDGTASVTNTMPGTIPTNVDFDGVGDLEVVSGITITPGASHVYAVTVDVEIAVGPGTDGDCVGLPGEGTGLLNIMTVTIDGEQPEINTACAGFSTLTLVKDVVNDDGGNASVADFPLTAAGSSATLTGVSGSADVSSAVPAGVYALSEQELVDGYTNAGWVCTGAATSTSDSVTLADGENAVCTIVNDDEPVDLELTKDDDGVEAVAGGAPFDYTISVQNIGDRDVDAGESVTVTDELPDGLSWVSFPANCSQAGQVLTCDIDPADLPAGGPAVVLTLTVEADADAASGDYENKAFVTTDDDPVCVGADCTPPPCPAAGNNNVDCEETPIDREGSISIVKTDDVADGDSVQPGDSFSYELVVRNVGTSTILPGTHVGDDLPAQLELVSVTAGAGWTCNDSDPIDCDYAPALAPGETAPSITVTVTVADDATGTEIDNVAIVRGAVDRDCPESSLAESFTPACNEVSDEDDETTPLVANADLAIVKTASVAQVGAGGGFDWTLVITNNGAGTAVDVVVGDVVPGSLVVTGVASSDFDCGNTGNDVACTVDSLAVGASGTVTISVTVPLDAAGGDVTNVGTVESSTPDPDLTNNSDDATVVVVAQEPPPTTLPPVTLPPTGSNGTHVAVRTATMLLLLGAAALLATRRRRSDDPAAV